MVDATRLPRVLQPIGHTTDNQWRVHAPCKALPSLERAMESRFSPWATDRKKKIIIIILEGVGACPDAIGPRTNSPRRARSPNARVWAPNIPPTRAVGAPNHLYF